MTGFTFSTYEQTETESDRKAAQCRVADLTTRALRAQDRLLALGAKHIDHKDAAATMRCAAGIRKLGDLIGMLGEINKNPRALDCLVAYGYADARNCVWTTPRPSTSTLPPSERVTSRRNRFARTARGWH
jgi:hypothetical protein